LLFNAPNNRVDTTGGTRNLFSGDPVKVQNFISAVNSQRPQPAPRSILLPPAFATAGHKVHSKKPVKSSHPTLSKRPRVPEIISKGVHYELVSHKTTGRRGHVR